MKTIQLTMLLLAIVPVQPAIEPKAKESCETIAFCSLGTSETFTAGGSR